MNSFTFAFHYTRKFFTLLTGLTLTFAQGDWTHRTAHNFALPLSDEVQLADQVQLIRPAWEYTIHTGVGKSGSGTAIGILEQGFEPTFGETASTIVADGVYLVSWSEATGEVIARPESITDRYYRGEENYEALAETYFRIDANWNTIALDAATGEKLWQVSEPSASLNFVSSKRGHNGIDPAAGNGVYVTTTITGRIFAYDIRTGEKRWEGHVGEWHERAEAFKAEALAERRIPGVGDDPFGYIRPGLVTVDDLVIVPDLRGGLIEDGRLYIAIGHPGKRPDTRRLGVFDLESGEELYRSAYNITNSVAAPTSYGDKIYWQITNTSAENAGIYIYQKQADGSIERTGEARYRTLGSMLTTDYSFPTDRPFYRGRTFLRGRTNIMALDLTQPPSGSADVQLVGAWAGFHRPVEGVFIADENREIASGRLEVPPRAELGVVGTTGRRTDVWSHIEFPEGLTIGEAWEAEATVHMAIFSWPAQLVMQAAEGNAWHGQWTRAFPGWDEPLIREGTIHNISEGGYARRGWPTGWLEDQPVTFFSDLEEGQERVILHLFGSLPREGGDFQNVTLCLDHDGEKIVSAVAGGFRYNQSYHEVDASGLTVTPEGITGTARLILNADPWLRDPDWKNGGSLMGQVTLDATFGEANDQGVYPVTGDWQIAWGVSGELTGEVRASLK